MNNAMNYPIAMSENNLSGLENMYPDLYIRLNPHIKNAANDISDDMMYNMTVDDVNRITDEAVAKSNIPDDPPMGHNADTIADVARILLLRELFDRDRGRGFTPFMSPFFLVPFDGHHPYMGMDGSRGRGWY